MTFTGAWAEYVVSTSKLTFEINEDVPMEIAARGTVNPLTVLGFIDKYRFLKCHGMINTAAASALGRMLNRICLKEKIPLLNIVRRSEQAELLQR